MGRVLLWLLGVPVTVAALFVVFGEHTNAGAAFDDIAIIHTESDR